MKTMQWIAVGLVLVFASALLALAGPSQTGQGIMVNLSGAGDYAIVLQNTYKFNKTTAATYFTNLWDGIAPTCDGRGCPGTAPAAPAPLSTKVNKGNPGKDDVTGKNECTFLTGGTLVGDTYTQSLSTGSNKDKNEATYTWTYVVTPTQATVDAFTAWDLVSSVGTGTTAHVDVTATIAGESAVNNTNNSKVGLKYSFDLGTTLSPRVVGLTITLDGVQVAWPNSTVNFPVNFYYTTNAGSNGNTALLKDGDARTILNTDSFAGNDNGGAGGAALALATMDTVGLDLAPGVHTVTLTGTVKGNNALADLPIHITQTVTVITPGCGSPDI